MNLKAGINLALISMLRAGWGKPQLSPAGPPGAVLLWPPGVPADAPGQIRLCVSPGKHLDKQQEQRICLADSAPLQKQRTCPTGEEGT